MNHFDVVIIGGGAAGMMAAISTKKHHPEYTVALVDRTFALGRKILVCGAGRCNITNVNLNSSVDDHYYGGSPEFIKGIFSQFSYEDIVAFFNELGVELYIERKTDIGKLFPVTDQAKTITAMLEDELERLGVQIFLETEVTKVINNVGGFSIDAQKIDKTNKVLGRLDLHSNYLILSAGGKTYPALGSNGSGYTLAQTFGHSLIDPVPSALPLEAKSLLSHELQGVKLELEVTSVIAGKEIKTRSDEVMFTKYGLSGPAILNVSREISIRMNRERKTDVQVRLNFFPGKSSTEIKDLLITRWQRRANQTAEKSLYGLFPNKVAAAVLELVNIPTDKKVSALNANEIENLVGLLSGFVIPVQGTKGWNEAEFTAGGIDMRELEANSLQSQKCPKLYLCGEILDVDGDVGGFNLSWAWSSGFVAGKLNG